MALTHSTVAPCATMVDDDTAAALTVEEEYHTPIPTSIAYAIDASDNPPNIQRTMPSANRRSTLAAAAAVATAAMAGTSTSVAVEAFSPVVSMSRTPAVMKPTAAAAATALRMSTADDEVAKLRAAAQKAREEAQALAKVSPMQFTVALSTFLDMRPWTCACSTRNSIELDRLNVLLDFLSHSSHR